MGHSIWLGAGQAAACRSPSRIAINRRILPAVDDATRARVIETVRAAFDPYVDGAEVRFTAACWMVDAKAAA